MADIFGSIRTDRLTASANNQALYGGANKTGSGTGNDTLNSSTYAGVSLYAGDGDDTLIAKSGDLVIDGGGGSDTVQLAASVSLHNNDDWLAGVESIVITSKAIGRYDFSDQTEVLSITGGAAADTIYGGSAADTLKGGGGNDELHVQTTDRLIDGGTGLDTVWFRANVTSALANATLLNVEKIDFEQGSAGSYDFSSQTEALRIEASTYGDQITGGTGADTITGGASADRLNGGKGNDVLVASEDDTIDGSEGIDTVQFASSVSAGDLSDGDLINVEKVEIAAAGSYDFSVQTEVLTIAGSGDADVITGGTANDSISGLTGNDSLLGSSGNDTLNGGIGDDTLVGGAGVDQLIGDVGNDTLVAEAADALIDGGEGVDTVRFAAAVAGLSDRALVRVEKIEITNTSNASYDFGFQIGGLTITGNSGDDSISGGKGADSISGGAGADTLIGNAGADTLLGGSGDDTLVAEEDDASIDGGDGVDMVVFRAAVSVSRLINTKLKNVEQVLIENTKTASYDFSAQSEGLIVTGSGVADSITGGTGADSIIGGAGNDTLKGGAGSDTILGGTGSDVIDGGAGIDTYLYTDAAESCVGNAAATSVQAAGIDKVIVVSGDIFDFQGQGVTLTGAAPIEITIPDVAKLQLTADGFMQAIAAGINEAADQAYLVKVIDQDKQAGTDGSFSGTYLIAMTDASFSSDDFIVQLVGVNPLTVTGAAGGGSGNISVI